MKARWIKHTLQFKTPGGTSRGILTTKESWFLILESPLKKGIGECGLLKGLSCDPITDYEDVLDAICSNINTGIFPDPEEFIAYPSIRMGLEMAYRSYNAEDPMVLYHSDFTSGKKQLPINGLIWMGSVDFMQQQIEAKLNEGYTCIKMKIGTMDFQQEFQLLKALRNRFSEDRLTLRVDANGAYSLDQAQHVLEALSKINVHSIEQPIAAGQSDAMAQLCAHTPVPIALDEALIGWNSPEEKAALLDQIRPQYIILKPSLLGGFAAAEEWIDLAKKNNIGWWVTSALESNIGLNAIAQWTAILQANGPQGLGTGSLYTNNFSGPLTLKNGYIRHANAPKWEIPF